MPQMLLTSYNPYAPIQVNEPNGNRLHLPRIQFRAWLRLPGIMFPRDAIIDTGSPFTWFPEDVWQSLRVSVDYEWLAFPTGCTPPRGLSVGWNFTFRFARFLQPIGLHDFQTELTRDGAIVQFANGNPPIPPGSRRPAFVVVGLWGGVLEGTALRISADAATGQAVGALEW
jgi:hypothetical protein